MRRVLFSCLLLAGAAGASDPTGIYALIERVEIREDTIRIRGAFALAGGKHGEFYAAPRWRELHFKLVKGREEQCRKEWAGLAKVAGSGEVVGFGSRRRIRASQEPAPYPLGWGVHRVGRADYGPVAMLKTLPKPAGPSRVVAQQWGQMLELRAFNALDNREG